MAPKGRKSNADDPPPTEEQVQTFNADVLQFVNENFYSAFVGYMVDEKGYVEKDLKVFETIVNKKDGRV
jgi:hypothetical protein